MHHYELCLSHRNIQPPFLETTISSVPLGFEFFALPIDLEKVNIDSLSGI